MGQSEEIEQLEPEHTEDDVPANNYQQAGEDAWDAAEAALKAESEEVEETTDETDFLL